MEEERQKLEKKAQAEILLEHEKGKEDGWMTYETCRKSAYQRIHDEKTLRQMDYRVALFFLRLRPFENTYRHVDPRHSYVYVSWEDACLST